ncbi:hypothetical protein PG994_006910 [Apiospora phragmitis]|uniref:Uncharacterized protein n=1 Tax=Apiospora phragmitis TaxID=2905665 RepID=A0ABR1VK25_9PEZI
MSSSNEDLRFKITGIDAGDADNVTIIIEDSGGRRIAVSVSSDHTPESAAADELIGLIHTPSMDKSSGWFDADPIWDAIDDAGASFFTPSDDRIECDQNLAPIYDREANIALKHPGGDAVQGFKIDDDLPQVSAADVPVLEIFSHGIGIECRVLVGDREMFCLAEPTGLCFPPFLHHLTTMQAVEKCRSNCPALCRIPKLLGYVMHAELGHVVGLLSECAPLGLQDGDESATYMDRLRAAAKERRQNWVRQIRETVNGLHQNDLIWRHGHLSKVLVDTNDDAWLTGFGDIHNKGDGVTELISAMEGDNEAVRSIARILGAEEEDHIIAGLTQETSEVIRSNGG